MEHRVNGLYCYSGVLEQARANFMASHPKMIFFKEFFSRTFSENVWKKLSAEKGRRIYQAEKFSYEALDVPIELEDFAKSEFFIDFLQIILGKKIKEVSLEARRFSHKDYVLINGENFAGKRVDFFFLFCDNGWEEKFGGYTAYSKKDGEPIIFPVVNNSLAIISVEKDMEEFVKYIKHFAGGKKLVKIGGFVK